MLTTAAIASTGCAAEAGAGVPVRAAGAAVAGVAAGVTGAPSLSADLLDAAGGFSCAAAGRIALTEAHSSNKGSVRRGTEKIEGRMFSRKSIEVDQKTGCGVFIAYSIKCPAG